MIEEVEREERRTRHGKPTLVIFAAEDNGIILQLC